MHLKSKLPMLSNKLFREFFFNLPNPNNHIYLTFDDGPHPSITPWVLQQLRDYDAKASFFCLGKNVEKHPEIVAQIISEGHSIGNHSYQHPNGWFTRTADYLADFEKSKAVITSELMRPPYGKMKPSQLRILAKQYKIIMWDVLTEDYDADLAPETCLEIIKSNTKSGSIIVLHDSEKAWKNLKILLPLALDYLTNARNFQLKAIEF